MQAVSKKVGTEIHEKEGISYRPFDRRREGDVRLFCPIFWEYWLIVNGEDLSQTREEDVLGVKIPLVRIETVLYGYLSQGFEIQLALSEPEVVGFLLHRVVCDHVLEVRAMYLEDRLWAKGVGKAIVQSLRQKPTKIIFQTRVEAPPERFLEASKPYRSLIAETERLKTWEMPWVG